MSLRPAAWMLFSTLVVFSVNTNVAHGQVRVEGGLLLTLGLPQGAFEDNVGRAGFGGNLFGGVGTQQMPVLVGLDLGLLIYGHERRNEPFSTTIPDVTVDVVTDNNIFLGHFFVRLQPPAGAVRPYLDGLLGLKHFFTETRIENEGFGDDVPIATSTNFNDTALSYGVGGGLDIAVYRNDTGPRTSTISLHLGVQYLFGSEASYLKKGSIRRENGEVRFDVIQSETNVLLMQVGVSVRL